MKFADQKKTRIKQELSLELDRPYTQPKSDLWFSQIQPMREAFIVDNGVLRDSRLVYPFNPNGNISQSVSGPVCHFLKY